jgi:hypothetical protein
MTIRPLAGERALVRVFGVRYAFQYLFKIHAIKESVDDRPVIPRLIFVIFLTGTGDRVGSIYRAGDDRAKCSPYLA